MCQVRFVLKGSQQTSVQSTKTEIVLTTFYYFQTIVDKSHFNFGMFFVPNIVIFYDDDQNKEHTYFSLI